MEKTNLDPQNALDAIKIIDHLTKELNVGNRHQTNIFNNALITLYNLASKSEQENKPEPDGK